MLDANGRDALQANLSECINKGVDSSTTPDDGTIRNGNTLISVLKTTYRPILIDFVHFILILFVYSDFMFIFATEIKRITIMDIKRITHEEALRRWKHSLEIKHEWERKVAERWANEDQQKIALA